jgi:hypothetical protein
VTKWDYLLADGIRHFCEKNTSLVEYDELALGQSAVRKSYDLFSREIEIFWNNKGVRVFENIIKTAHLWTIHTEMLVDHIWLEMARAWSILHIPDGSILRSLAIEVVAKMRGLKWTGPPQNDLDQCTINSSAIDWELYLSELLSISEGFIKIMISEGISSEGKKW